ncbi:MAG: bifunctional DNA-formamidopyrimidine glycosylase/DNA-(apurinic or apyrimidinic site) lyase [Pseudomonadota bacterium]|nr:bifunctional DNA-formamidopyrimidine glycosylase/DNA-(apurinic or apyrimidinic site) lyase [Pseudomonadota bacterium]
MPELPEVETVRRGLAPVLAGARIVRAEARRPDLRFPFPERFAQRLAGARAQTVERRAKYLLAGLDTGQTWVTHLGMTGRFLVERGGEGGEAPGRYARAAPAEQKHAHLLLETDAGIRITFFDARRFGYMGLIPTAELASHPWFADLGPEPLGPEFDAPRLLAGFAGRRQAVKTVLLDQRVVAGLGNIYVCEALHRAGISPKKPAGKVGRAAAARLVEAIRAVLGDAIEAGGSTLRDYASAEGLSGLFQHSFAVYGREDEPCPRMSCSGVVRRYVQGGRSTFGCSACQR